MRKHLLTKLTPVAATFLTALVVAGCGGSAPAVQPSTGAPASSPIVTPLTGDQAAGNMSIKLADGTAPCGVFNVNGFGDKTATLADYPACKAASYQVMCLDDKAQWQSGHITGVKLSDDKKQIIFSSEQEGTCGLFPGK